MHCPRRLQNSKTPKLSGAETTDAGLRTLFWNSLRQLVSVSTNGAVVVRYTYDAWGNLLSEECSVPALAANRYRFQGREYSAATGLVNFRARWYDPETGRWLSKDPIGLAGGLNLYGFCGAEPVNFQDPFGQEFWKNAGNFLRTVGQGAAKSLDFLFNGILQLLVYNPSLRDNGTQGLVNDVILEAIGSPLKCLGAYDSPSPAPLPEEVVDAAWSIASAAVVYSECAGKDSGSVAVGTKLYRVYGGNSAELGHSWTPTDPRNVQNYRNFARLPNGNSGEFMAEGILRNSSGVTVRSALPLDGNTGGIIEILVPNPGSQISPITITPITPPF